MQRRLRGLLVEGLDGGCGCVECGCWVGDYFRERENAVVDREEKSNGKASRRSFSQCNLQLSVGLAG
jgi:hypothetical protein